MRYPALDISGIDSDLALAFADDYSPTAADDSSGFLTLFFSDVVQRDRAHAALASAFPDAQLEPREVDDGDWARRSQENLGPVTVGRVTVVPPWRQQSATAADDSPTPPAGAEPPRASLRLVIQPSMAFGTGHHATTRLCLAGLQLLELSDKFVVDIGTGSGVLAIAARALGARQALGIDNDPDAIRCARENLALNDEFQDGVVFEVADLVSNRSDAGRPVVPPFQHRQLSADVITANLTGALLRRSASELLDTLAPGGTLILSGILEAEHDDVLAAFDRASLVWEAREEEWMAIAIRGRSPAIRAKKS